MKEENMIRVLIIILLSAGIVIDEYHEPAVANASPSPQFDLVRIVSQFSIDETVFELNSQGYRLIDIEPFVVSWRGPSGNAGTRYGSSYEMWENQYNFILTFRK